MRRGGQIFPEGTISQTGPRPPSAETRAYIVPLGKSQPKAVPDASDIVMYGKWMPVAHRLGSALGSEDQGTTGRARTDDHGAPGEELRGRTLLGTTPHHSGRGTRETGTTTHYLRCVDTLDLAGRELVIRRH